MNKEFQRQLDDSLSGMNWTEREQNSILRRIAQEEENEEKPVRRSIPRWAVAMAATLLVLAGGALLSRQALLPPQDQHLSARPQGTETVFAALTGMPSASPDAHSSGAMPTAAPAADPILAGVPLLQTKLLSFHMIDASYAGQTGRVHMNVSTRETGRYALHLAGIDALSADSRYPLYVTLNMQALSATGEAAAEIVQVGGKGQVESAEVTFVASELPVQEALHILLNVEVHDHTNALVDQTAFTFTLWQDGAVQRSLFPTVAPASQPWQKAMQLPADVPTRKEALAAVTQQCTDAVLLDVIDAEFRSQKNMQGWQIRTIVYDLDPTQTPQYEERKYIVQKGKTGDLHVTRIPEELKLTHEEAAGIIASAAENDVRLRQWEAERGQWYFWSPEEKASYCEQYGVCPEAEWDRSASRWAYPTEEDLSYAAASAAAWIALEKQYDLDLTELTRQGMILKEDARLVEGKGGRSQREFRYWMPVQEEGLSWVQAACVAQNQADFHVRYLGIEREMMLRIAELAAKE